ncbi:TetR/AcrR family transcriptional regulator [Paenibacillus soyae]|uniref:TetR/AcrR family transcriptional regulator n=1 Tax=Paenibacillus soyae TaxID=2969249 RepID=A0A9X2MUB7_9BACL|nr:TetR/AcrR family transcriptional regulator [Paenibacillus soyae]MCR2806640.1 TetR/AcrR family transcriptional regulator [Paenibacillus soyae]
MRKNTPTVSNRDVVLQTASNLFLTRGYQVTSMDEIVSMSKVSKTNIYYHFKSKEELLLAIVDQLIAHYEYRLSHILSQSHMPFMEKLERFFEIVAGEQEQNDFLGGCPILTLYTQTSMESAEVRSRIKGFFERQLEHVESLLLEGSATGLFPSNLPARATATLIVSSVEGALFVSKATERPQMLKDLLHALAAMLK